MSIDISLIVAMSRNRVIGRDGRLPWRLPNDMKFFRQQTLGKPIIMGRKTYESIGKPLAQRTNIILTRDESYTAEGCLIAHSPEEALALAQAALGDGNEIVIGGGAAVYDEFLPITTRIYLTLVEAEVEGDTHFPEIDMSKWQEVWQESHAADERHAFNYNFVLLERR